MNYFVKRGDKEYGPYTLAALQQYVAQGNISANDQARSEGMQDWVAVSTIIGNIPAAAPSAATGFGAVSMTGAGDPEPPGLHWAVVLVLCIVTFGLFGIIWIFVQAAWVRKVVPQSQAILYLCGYFVGVFGSVALNLSGMHTIAPLLNLAGLIVYIMGIFKLRSDIEEYYGTLNPAGMHLSGVMTFFFNMIYFQYHMPEIKEAQQAVRARAAGA